MVTAAYGHLGDSSGYDRVGRVGKNCCFRDSNQGLFWAISRLWLAAPSNESMKVNFIVYIATNDDIVKEAGKTWTQTV